MRRWHEDLPLMFRRWRYELRKHGLDPGPYLGSYRRGAAIYVSVCPCEKGPGVMRKRDPWDCGRPRCGLCHWSKVHGLPARHTCNWLALQFEAAATTDGLGGTHLRLNRFRR
jgi:hypothetical protein